MDSKTMDCPSCGQMAAQMKEDSSISYRQYDQLLQKLMELERQGDMELYAGDCPLEDTGAVPVSYTHLDGNKVAVEQCSLLRSQMLFLGKNGVLYGGVLGGDGL